MIQSGITLSDYFQELVYERPYMVLPPIMEWVRVSSCFTDHRNSEIVDENDVLQAAR